MSTTLNYKMYELLYDGSPVNVDKIAESLGIERKSVAVYIHTLKSIGGNVNTIRDGKRVEAYQLLNASDFKVILSKKGKKEIVLAERINLESNTIPKTTNFKKKEIEMEDDYENIVENLSDKEITDIGLKCNVDVFHEHNPD